MRQINKHLQWKCMHMLMLLNFRNKMHDRHLRHPSAITTPSAPPIYVCITEALLLPPEALV